MANTEIIPVIDLGPYLAGVPAQSAAQLRIHFALTEIGFYFIVNRGVPSEQIHAVFCQAARFHALPFAKEAGGQIRQAQCRLPTDKGRYSPHSTVETVTKPNIAVAPAT